MCHISFILLNFGWVFIQYVRIFCRRQGGRQNYYYYTLPVRITGTNNYLLPLTVNPVFFSYRILYFEVCMYRGWFTLSPTSVPGITNYLSPITANPSFFHILRYIRSMYKYVSPVVVFQLFVQPLPRSCSPYAPTRVSTYITTHEHSSSIRGKQEPIVVEPLSWRAKNSRTTSQK